MIKGRKIAKNLVFSFALFFHVIAVQGKTGAQAKEKSPPKWNILKVSTLVRKTRKEDLEKLLREFVYSGKPNRLVGTKGHADALEFLRNKIAALDPEGAGKISEVNFVPDIEGAKKFYQDDFDQLIKAKYSPKDEEYKKWDGFTKNMLSTLKDVKNVRGTNLTWFKKGSLYPEEVMVIGAHYDSIVYDKKTFKILPKEVGPGANDNGSAVAVALALIKTLAPLDLPRSVEIVFFDFEEVGFLGSKDYAHSFSQKIKKENLKFLGMINLEMLGQDTSSLDKEGKYGNMKLYIRKSDTTADSNSGPKDDLKFAQRLVAFGEKTSSGVDFAIDPNGFNVSDNINFWDKDLLAVAFSQNWETDFNDNGYHSSSDIPEAVNFKTLAASYHFIAGAVLGVVLDL